jgi:hypothetical protein
MDTSTDRTHYRTLVAEVATKAKKQLPECNGRVEKAVALVLNTDVELHDDGTAIVSSQTDATRHYRVVNGACVCRDYEQAPHHFCKHRIAAGIARRVQEMLAESMRAADTAADTLISAPLPEAPASVNVRVTIGGREVQVTLRDSDETRLLQRLETLLARYPEPQRPVQGSRTAAGWCAVHQVQMQRNEKAAPKAL